MRLLKNLRVRLAKKPIRAASYECDNAETNPESPKPNRVPDQLRFCAGELLRQIAAFFFQLADPRSFFAQLFLQRLTLRIGAQRQLELMADLEIVFQDTGVLVLDFFFGNFEGGRNDFKIVAGPYLPRLTPDSRQQSRSNKKRRENEKKKENSLHKVPFLAPKELRA